MKRTRKPGAGRKSQGPIKGKVATLTTRIRQDTRSALERGAEINGRSLSQEIEVRLVESLKAPKKTGLDLESNHTHALCLLIGLLARSIEGRTGRDWRSDGYTNKAVRAGVATLIAALSKAGEVELPERIRERFGEIPEMMARYENPAVVGGETAGGLLDGWPMAADPQNDHDLKHHYLPSFHTLAKVRDLLTRKETKS